MLFQEFGDDAEGTRTRESLYRSDAIAAHERAIPSKDHALGALFELGKTVDRKVLFVERCISDDGSLSLTNDREHIRLSIVVTIGAHTEVDLLWVRVVPETSCEGENGVGGCHGHALKCISLFLFFFCVGIVKLFRNELFRYQARSPLCLFVHCSHWIRRFLWILVHHHYFLSIWPILLLDDNTFNKVFNRFLILFNRFELWPILHVPLLCGCLIFEEVTKTDSLSDLGLHMGG